MIVSNYDSEMGLEPENRAAGRRRMVGIENHKRAERIVDDKKKLYTIQTTTYHYR